MKDVGCVTLAARGLGKGPAGPRFRPPFLEPTPYKTCRFLTFLIISGSILGRGTFSQNEG